MRTAAKAAGTEIELLGERVTQLSSSVNYIVPTGKLRMKHWPSKAEVLWIPAEPIPGPPQGERRHVKHDVAHGGGPDEEATA